MEVATPSGSTGPVPVMVDVELLALPAAKITVPPLTLTGEVMDKVFVSALVDFKVHVDTPDAFEEEHVP